MTNPQVLDKQLLHISLSKGVNERDRPETADPTTTLTRVENLVQDQTGAFVKRPGNTVLANVTSAGAALVVQRLIRTTNGLVAIDVAGSVLQYLDGLAGFVKKDRVPLLSVFGAAPVASSGPGASSIILSTASSTKYHAVVVGAGLSATGSSLNALVFYDIVTGATVAKYIVSTILSSSATTDNVKVIWVADRYLMVFCNNKVTSVDMGGTTPPSVASLQALAKAFTTTADSPGFMDVAASSTRAFITSAIVGAYKVTAVVAATCTVQESAALPGVAHISILGSDLWWTTDVSWGALSVSALGTVTVTSGATTGISSGTVVGFFAQSATNIWFVTYTLPAFGSTTLQRLAFSVGNTPATSITAISSIDGWTAVSNPFTVGSASNDIFLHVCKNAGLDVSPHCVMSFNRSAPVITNNGQNSYVYGLEAVLDPYIGVYPTAVGTVLYRPSLRNGGNSVALAVASRTTARGCAYSVFDVRAGTHSKKRAVTFGGETYITGGAHSIYDGDRLGEVGVADIPLMSAAASATAGVIPVGSYKYVAVYRSTDSSSAGCFSRCSTVASVIAPGVKKNDITVTGCQVTNRRPSLAATLSDGTTSVIVDLYRTLSGGTQFYLCASSQVGTPFGSLLTQVLGLQASGYYTVSDNLTDAQLASQPLLFRQPGTPNSALDRYPPPGGDRLCQHRDRLFTSDAYGFRIYYSSFFVDGECAWFHPALSFAIHGGTGPITAIASMDGRLFVFKKDSLFVIDGDGPGEAGPTGNEYSPPQRLATEYGCVDGRSVVVTGDGIVYRSTRGIELLTRNLQVKWVGESVWATVNAFPNTVSAAVDTYGRVHIVISASDPVIGSVAGQNGRELIWDVPADCWTIYQTTPSDGVYGHSSQDVCLAQIAGKGEVLVYADTLSGVTYSDYSSGLDRGVYVGWTIETCWIKAGQQVRQRISRALLLAKKLAGANHRITMSVAYNYLDGYTQAVVFEPGIINDGLIEQLEVQMSAPETLAVRVLIQESAPSDTATYPVGTGRGCDVLGVTFEVAPKAGAPMLPGGKRGASSVVVVLNSILTEAGDPWVMESGDPIVMET